MKYQQLTQDERYMIGQLRRQGYGLSEIARLLGRNRSTIWRELKRNMVETPKGPTYCVSKAHCVSKAQEQPDGRLRRSRRGPSTAQRTTPWCDDFCWSSGARSRSRARWVA